MPRSAARAVATSCCWPMVRRGEHRVGGHSEAEIVEQRLPRRANHRPMLQQAKPRKFVAQEQVGGDRQMPAEHDLLMHRVDAQLDRVVRRIQRHRRALPEDLAGAARIDAGEQFYQRGLAGAVLADDGVDFAGSKVRSTASGRAWRRSACRACAGRGAARHRSGGAATVMSCSSDGPSAGGSWIATSPARTDAATASGRAAHRQAMRSAYFTFGIEQLLRPLRCSCCPW